MLGYFIGAVNAVILLWIGLSFDISRDAQLLCFALAGFFVLMPIVIISGPYLDWWLRDRARAKRRAKSRAASLGSTA